MIIEPNNIYLGDCLSLMREMPDKSVDLVLTDPPYPKEYLPLWSGLAEQSKRLLKPGGYCITYSGQLFMPEVLQRMTQFLDYRWCIALLHSQTQIVWPVKSFANWKPIFVFRNGYKDETGERIRCDVIRPSGADKKYHKWGQPVGESIELILDYSQEGDLVLDPFLGSGTTAVACIKTGRRYIGMEIDPTYYEIAKKRIDLEKQQMKLAL